MQGGNMQPVSDFPCKGVGLMHAVALQLLEKGVVGQDLSRRPRFSDPRATVHALVFLQDGVISDAVGINRLAVPRRRKTYGISHRWQLHGLQAAARPVRRELRGLRNEHGPAFQHSRPPRPPLGLGPRLRLAFLRQPRLPRRGLLGRPRHGRERSRGLARVPSCPLELFDDGVAIHLGGGGG